MGNNTSTSSTRKSTAAQRVDVRMSLASTHASLEDEFSSSILHPVRPSAPAANPQFTNHAIEDEFNELNDGLLENDTTLSRNIIPDKDNGADAMDVDEPVDRTPTPSFSRIDFTKVAPSPQELLYTAHADDKPIIPVEVKWVNTSKEDIGKISIIGSFSNWRDVIKLRPLPGHPNEYVATIGLPLGVHKLLYIINNEYRVSDQLPTATDQEGIFFNWFEVLDPHHLFNHLHNQPNHVGASTDYDANIIQVAGKRDVLYINEHQTKYLAKESKNTPDFEHVEDMDHSPGYDLVDNLLTSLFLQPPKPARIAYSSEIPDMFVNYDYFKTKGPDYELPEPPQLPAHLNNVLLNKISAQQHLHQHHLPTPVTHHVLRPPNPDYEHKRPALRRADSSYYASNKEAYHLLIPNHVILNHLMTTSIRNDVLTVACITRYSGKFVTQIMHSPAE